MRRKVEKYVSVMVTLGAFLLLALLVMFIHVTTKFLKSKMREAREKEYRVFREVLDFPDSPVRLELFIVKYPNSIYCEHAQFEIGEKYFQKRQYRLAKEAYEKFLSTYPNSFHCEIAKSRIKEIEKFKAEKGVG